MAPPRVGRAGRLILVVALLAGLALRLKGVADPPLTFHPTRQYAGLAVAKARYLDLRPDAPAWELAAAEANGRAAPRLEPRLVEWVVAGGYLLLGGERLWLGGAVSSLLWIGGGWWLYLLARRLASAPAAGAALAVHLFLPYGIVASRSFQPDPAMVALMLGGLLAVVRHHELQTGRRLAAAVVLSAGAVVVKPVAAPFLVGAFLALAVHRAGWRRVWREPATWAFPVLSLLPGALVYGVGLLRGGGLGSQAEMSFIPGLLLEGAYRSGWLHLVSATAGIPLALVALASVVVARRRDARALMAGLWGGYIVYGLVFDYHISSHDYYQLPFLPVVALGVGLVVDAAWARLRRMDLGPSTRVAVGLALGLLAVVVAVEDVAAARPQSPSFSAAEVAEAGTIGNLVGHSTRVVLVAPAYGWHLVYHGNLAGPAWPSVGQGDFRLAKLQGRPPRATADLLDAHLRAGAEWFVVTDLPELDHQPDLRPLLDQQGRLAAATDDYLVYDLRR